MQIYVHCEETGVPRENPWWHRVNIQTPQSKAIASPLDLKTQFLNHGDIIL